MVNSVAVAFLLLAKIFNNKIRFIILSAILSEIFMYKSVDISKSYINIMICFFEHTTLDLGLGAFWSLLLL